MKRIAIVTAALLVLTGARAQNIPLPEDLPRTELKALCKASYEPMTGQYGDGAHAPAILWRCSHGHVYACMAGADGVACSKRTRSRTPYPGMIEACRDEGYMPVVSGVMSFVWRWECKDGKPVIVNSDVSRFDTDGYYIDEWTQIR